MWWIIIISSVAYIIVVLIYNIVLNLYSVIENNLYFYTFNQDDVIGIKVFLAVLGKKSFEMNGIKKGRKNSVYHKNVTWTMYVHY